MIEFTEDGETYWFDPETADTNYKGESDEMINVLANIESMAYKLKPPEEEDPELTEGAPAKRVYDPEEAEEIVLDTVRRAENVTLVED